MPHSRFLPLLLVFLAGVDLCKSSLREDFFKVSPERCSFLVPSRFSGPSTGPRGPYFLSVSINVFCDFAFLETSCLWVESWLSSLAFWSKTNRNYRYNWVLMLVKKRILSMLRKEWIQNTAWFIGNSSKEKHHREAEKWQRRGEEQRREVEGAHLAHQTSFRCSFIRYFLGAYKMLGTEVTGTLLNKRDMVPALMMLIFYMTEDKE